MKNFGFVVLIAASAFLTALSFHEPWIDYLAYRVGVEFFAAPIGSLGTYPVYELPDYRAIGTGGFRAEAISLVWPDIVRPVHLLLALLLLFHVASWRVMGRPSWKWVFKGIDYVWYLGASAALILAATDYVVGSAFSSAYVATQNFEQAKSMGLPITNRMIATCENPDAPRFEFDGLTMSVCTFGWGARNFWEFGEPLCERSLIQSGRFDAVETWGSVITAQIDPVRCSREPQAFYTCAYLQRITDRLIGEEAASVVEARAPYDLTYLRKSDLAREHPSVLDVFRMCRLISIGREIAAEIGDNTKVQLAVAGFGPIKSAWLQVLAFAIAIRLVKTTADVRESWPTNGIVPPLRSSRALFLPAVCVILAFIAFAASGLGLASLSDGWRLPYAGWQIPILRWAVYLLAGLAVLGSIAGLALAPWIVDKTARSAETVADDEQKDLELKTASELALRIASIVSLLAAAASAYWAIGWI